MSDRLAKKIAAALVMSIAVIEHIGLIWYARDAFLKASRHPTDMPFGCLIAFVLYLTAGISLASAARFYVRSGDKISDIEERVLWTGGAMIIAPWIAILLCIPGYWLGPVGLLLAPLIGGTAPYLLIAAMLQPSPPRG